MTELENSLIDSDTRKKIINRSRFFLGSLFLLILMGLYALASVSLAGKSFIFQQLIFYGVSIFSAFCVVLLGYKKLFKLTPYFICIMILLLLGVFFFEKKNGAYRWIKIPFTPFKIQPSELLKFVIVIVMSQLAYTKSSLIKNINSFKEFLLFFRKHLIVPSILILLVLCGRDLGTTLLLTSYVIYIMWVAGLKLKFFITLVILLFFSATIYVLSSPPRLQRMVSYWERLCGIDDGVNNEQLEMSLKALGSGGLKGVGVFEGKVKNKIPEKSTDFILATIGEELGFIGAVAVAALYLSFFIFGNELALLIPSERGRLLIIGYVYIIVIQSFINIGVVYGSLPTKGMPAALLSKGGSNLLFCISAVGVIISVSLDALNSNYNKGFFSRIKSSLPFMTRS
jgi:cell division protein FtsW